MKPIAFGSQSPLEANRLWKPIAFVATALDDPRAFRDEARRQAGYQLDRVQRGLDLDDWKPMTSIRSGVREIRVRDEIGTFRVIYIATLADAVYVLHAFKKTTRQTAKRDLDLAASRLRQISGRRTT